MANLSSIHDQIFNSNDAKRIAMKMNTKDLNSDNYTASAKRKLNDIFPDWESDPRFRFVAMEVYHEGAYIAIDISHRDYNFNTAHEDMKPLPVYFLGKVHKGREWTLIRMPQEDDYICTRLAYLHRCHGYDAELPLVDDYTSIVFHANPR